ncbi:MAG: EscU/YscU/HrcU family type III secretion system export apparatus switch protein [Planctomycetaceae bacterium]|nr:EscU/YscU/HrcU family type III secretion system export apparatus switch protein [Planctomycetaceae bacterium]
MSEDRTQGQSKQRRQQARERGLVAHSPELTGAVGLLAASALLAIWGDDLTAALLGLVREPLIGAARVSADPAEVVARLRHLALAVAWPLGGLVVGFAAAALAAHQVQVGGLWAPSLLAPDPARLWAAGRGPGLATRATRGAWSVIKAAVVAVVAAWTIWSGWRDFQRLGGLEAGPLARASGLALRDLALRLALATLVLGLIDYGDRSNRLEAQLRMTPEEQREDQRATEGDPALRARRRRLARAWNGDPGEILAGASLVLTGPAGLTLVLAGGPPPRRVVPQWAARGSAGARLRRSAEARKLPLADAPDLARRLARRRAPGLALPADALAELAPLWPAPSKGRAETGPAAG